MLGFMKLTIQFTAKFGQVSFFIPFIIYLLGCVYKGAVIFPDFFNPASVDYWYNQAAAFHATGPEFDGMWIDMNELSNFCTAQCEVRDHL